MAYFTIICYSILIMSLLAVNIAEEFKISESGKAIQDVFSTPADLLSLIIKNVYVIAGIILFFFIIIGGMTIILNAGNPEQQKKGSKTVTSAVIGFIIIFTSYWIVRIIELITKVNILNPGAL